MDESKSNNLCLVNTCYVTREQRKQVHLHLFTSWAFFIGQWIDNLRGYKLSRLHLNLPWQWDESESVLFIFPSGRAIFAFHERQREREVRAGSPLQRSLQRGANNAQMSLGQSHWYWSLWIASSYWFSGILCPFTVEARVTHIRHTLASRCTVIQSTSEILAYRAAGEKDVKDKNLFTPMHHPLWQVSCSHVVEVLWANLRHKLSMSGCMLMKTILMIERDLCIGWRGSQLESYI